MLEEANTEQAIAVRDLVTWGRHRGASALARRNPVCRVTALSATRTAGQQGDRDHDPDQDQEIRHEILFQDWPCLAAGSPRRWIIQTVIIPETRHWTKTAIERTATTSTATMITTLMINRDGATDSPSTASSGEPGNQPERHVPS